MVELVRQSTDVFAGFEAYNKMLADLFVYGNGALSVSLTGIEYRDWNAISMPPDPMQIPCQTPPKFRHNPGAGLVGRANYSSVRRGFMAVV